MQRQYSEFRTSFEEHVEAVRNLSRAASHATVDWSLKTVTEPVVLGCFGMDLLAASYDPTDGV